MELKVERSGFSVTLTAEFKESLNRVLVAVNKRLETEELSEEMTSTLAGHSFVLRKMLASEFPNVFNLTPAEYDWLDGHGVQTGSFLTTCWASLYSFFLAMEDQLSEDSLADLFAVQLD